MTHFNIIRTWNICIRCRCNIIRQLSEHYCNVLCFENHKAKFREPACYHKHCTIGYINLSQHCFPWRIRRCTQCDSIDTIAHKPISCMPISFVQSSHGDTALLICARLFVLPKQGPHCLISHIRVYSSHLKLNHGARVFRKEPVSRSLSNRRSCGGSVAAQLASVNLRSVAFTFFRKLVSAWLLVKNCLVIRFSTHTGLGRQCTGVPANTVDWAHTTDCRSLGNRC